MSGTWFRTCPARPCPEISSGETDDAVGGKRLDLAVGVPELPQDLCTVRAEGGRRGVVMHAFAVCRERRRDGDELVDDAAGQSLKDPERLCLRMPGRLADVVHRRRGNAGGDERVEQLGRVASARLLLEQRE